MSGLTILAAGSDDQKQTYLPAISRGEIVTFALTEADGNYEAASIKAKAAHGKEGYVISGTKLFVPYAHVADRLLCLARTAAGSKPEDGLSLFLVDGGSPGVRSAVLSTIAGDKQCEVVLDKVKVPRENVVGERGEGWRTVQQTLRWAAMAKCAEMVGAAQQVLEMSVAYAKERVQFDRPIGTFQAVQHHCANMLLDVDGMRYLTYEAAWLLSNGLPAVKEVAMAKTWASEAIGRVVRLGHQIHGGVGYTIDHDLQLYYRRGKAAQALFGDASYHRELIAGQLGL
jgi:alkylation response protein AidB-like acyl-CoA dehydrogenase